MKYINSTFGRDFTQVLDLVKPENSTVKYNIIKFNDGETHIKFEHELDRKDDILVVSRISSWDELMLLMQVGDILRREEMDVYLYIGYLLGMRMDRVISHNEAYTLKIVANMINTIGAKKVVINEPHSSKTTDLINNSVGTDFMVDTFIPVKFAKAERNENILFVFPDAGAYKRYNGKINSIKNYFYRVTHGADVHIATCKKKRDVNTGQLLGFEIENKDTVELIFEQEVVTKIVVIDDLSDNGGTFMGIADLFKEYNTKMDIYLTHLVSEKGFENLSSKYNDVYVTNSHREWLQKDNVHVIDVYNYEV